MQTINEVSSGTKRHPACRQDAKVDRQTPLCYTSIQKNKGVRPPTYQPAHREGSSPQKTQG